MVVTLAAAVLVPVAAGPVAAQASQGSGEVAVIANGWSPPDVGAAAPLAGRLNAAVLYASKDALGQPTIDALEELNPDRVLLMGGPAALAPAVEAGVRRVLSSVSVERFSGTDRIDTAARAALSAPAVPAGRPVVIANGWSPSDVGAAAPLAASLSGSVLFAQEDSLGAPTINALRRLAPSLVILVGGTAALSTDIKTELARVVPGVPVERLAGADRVDTAARGAARADVGLGEAVVLANGWEPADVGIAAPLAAALGGSVLFTQRTSLGERTAEALAGLAPSKIILIGGSERLARNLDADLERLHPATPRVNIAGPDRIATAALAALFGAQASAEQQRFEEAVATIAPGEADCDAAPQLDVAGIDIVDPPADLNDPTAPLTVAEVVRIAGGCALVDYVALNGRTVAEVRDLLDDHPDVFAVGEPLRGFEPTHDSDENHHHLFAPDEGDPHDDGAGEQWHLPAKYMEDLWDGWDPDNPVTVAVIDTGVDVTHPDLADRIVDTPLGDCHDEDEHGHGTHVAGIIAAEQGDQGVAGVAPQARILPIGGAVKGTTCSIVGAALAVIEALNRPEETRAKVINMSFGRAYHRHPPSDSCGQLVRSDWRLSDLTDRVENLEKTVGELTTAVDNDCHPMGQVLEIAEELNVAAVAAAGNCGNDCEAWDWDLDPKTGDPINWRQTPNAVNAFSLPAGSDTVIAVGAVGRDGDRSDFSTSQGYVHIAAPGGNHSPGILSTVPLLACVKHTHPRTGDPYWSPNGCGIDDPPVECSDAATLDPNPFNQPEDCAHRVGYASGTSMASPFVAGVVAHMLNRHPGATPAQVRQALAETAKDQGDPGRDDEYGHGIVQPLAAIERLGQILAGPDVEPGITVSPLQLDIDEGSTASYTVALDTEPAGTVRVEVALSVSTDVRAAPSTLVFTPEDFWEPQTVTVTVPEDPAGADQPFAALHTATGGGYDDAGIANVAIIVRSSTPTPSLASLSLWGSSCDPVTSGLVLLSSCGSAANPALATDPGFDPEQLSYTVSVPAGTRFVTIDAVPADGFEADSLSPPDADPGTRGHQVRVSESISVPPSDRADKPGTSAAVGERFLDVVGSNWSGAVIVASSENFPDGLAAASLAGALRAPILLTPKNRLDPSIARFVRDNNVREVIIMGGPAAISEAVKNELDGILGNSGWSSRLWGQDRYHTALRIAERVVQDAGAVGDLCGTDQRSVFIATGRNSADALAASPAAYAAKMPVLLVDPRQRTLNSGVRDFIREHGIETAVILGGNAAVPERLQRELSQLGAISRVQRVAGADRYATAAQLAQDITSDCYHGGVRTIGLANGQGFGDALAAGPLTAELHGVMLLTGPDDVPPATLDAMTQIGKEAQLTNITLALLAVGDIVEAGDAVAKANNTAGRQLHGQPALGPATSLAASSTTTCAVRTDGTVQCWGRGRLSTGASDGAFVAIATGGELTCGITTQQRAKCFILTDQRGQPWASNQDFIKDVNASTVRFSAIAIGKWNYSRTVCGVRVDGTLECWGSADRLASYIESRLTGTYTSVSLGTNEHLCGLTTDGAIQCVTALAAHRIQSQDNDYEILTNGTFTDISTGSFTRCGVHTRGTVHCAQTGRHTAAAMQPNGQFVSVDTYGHHTCGLKTNGTIECWGFNGNGETDAPSGQFVAVTTGRYHSCGIRTNGAVECWGSNHYGQSEPPTGQFRPEALSQPDIDTPPLTSEVETIFVASSESPGETEVTVTVIDPHQPGNTTAYHLTIHQEGRR